MDFELPVIQFMFTPTYCKQLAAVNMCHMDWQGTNWLYSSSDAKTAWMQIESQKMQHLTYCKSPPLKDSRVTKKSSAEGKKDMEASPSAWSDWLNRRAVWATSACSPGHSLSGTFPALPFGSSCHQCVCVLDADKPEQLATGGFLSPFYLTCQLFLCVVFLNKPRLSGPEAGLNLMSSHIKKLSINSGSWQWLPEATFEIKQLQMIFYALVMWLLLFYLCFLFHCLVPLSHFLYCKWALKTTHIGIWLGMV